MSIDPVLLRDKYGAIIAEEVNVKQVTLLGDDQEVSVQYVPLGSALGAQFGKDTGRIISAAKQGDAMLADTGKLEVKSGTDTWVLGPEQFEVRYSGFDEPHQIVQEGVMIELDLQLTDDLIQEGVAREMSRFLNQMRKDAGYEISDRVACGYVTHDPYLIETIEQFADYLQQEALLRSIVGEQIAHDYHAEFVYEQRSVVFYLQR